MDINFQELLDQATDLVHVVSPDGTILYVNSAWERALGYQPNEVLGRSIYSFIQDGDREKFKMLREKLVVEHRSHQQVSTVLLTKNLQPLAVEGFISTYVSNGEVKYTHSILRDVTERQQQEQQWKDIIEHAPDAIIVIDAESRIKFWNPKSEKLFGWTFSEVEGTLLGDTIIPPQYRKAHYDGMKRFLSTGNAHVLNQTIEITALNKKGEEFYVALTISEASLLNQLVFIAFIRDISVQRKMAEEIQHQKQVLEKTNVELAQYAALASHDLKEPVRKILTFCSVFKEKAMDGNIVIERIDAAAKRMQDVMLGISRFSSIGAMAEAAAPVALNLVISEVMNDMDDVIRANQATILVRELPEVKMHSGHIYQLFQNILSNAIKYSKEDEYPVVDITADETGNGFVSISVKDNGIGFSNAYSEKVFQPFQRLHGNSFSGTGIGLAICKKIVDLYGGEINVNSSPGEGTVFTFRLPVG